MNGCSRPSPPLTALSVAAIHTGALAVNGAQPGGNESRNAAMGGTSIALPLDAGTSLTSKAQTFLLGFHYTF